MRHAYDRKPCPCHASMLALALGAAFPALAQVPAAEPSATALEVIVVKGRGRDETQQTVPLSVKAFSSKAIEDAGKLIGTCEFRPRFGRFAVQI